MQISLGTSNLLLLDQRISSSDSSTISITGKDATQVHNYYESTATDAATTTTAEANLDRRPSLLLLFLPRAQVRRR
jgi:hypothetical protein